MARGGITTPQSALAWPSLRLAAGTSGQEAHLNSVIPAAALGLAPMRRTLSMKAIMGVKEENERIVVKDTLDNIERWPVKRKGYSQV